MLSSQRLELGPMNNLGPIRKLPEILMLHVLYVGALNVTQ